MAIEQLSQTFKDTANWTWNRKGSAHVTGLSFSEESVTEAVLLEFGVRHPKLVWIQEFTKPQEGLNGADWLWVFAGKHKWFPMIVQAKALSTDTRQYESLDYPKKKTATKQIDKLINTAKTKGYYPAYVFYNYVDPLFYGDITWRCPIDDTAGHISLFGCSVADAYTVRSKMTTPHLINLSPVSRPWHCLACAKRERDGKRPSLISSVHRVASRLALSRQAKDLEQRVPEPLDHSPEYVKLALQAKTPEARRNVVQELMSLTGDVDGLVIVGETLEAMRPQ